MRQVPMKYLIIGSGRVARHFEHYLGLLKIPVKTWSRRHSNQDILLNSLQDATHILLAVSDKALAEVESMVLSQLAIASQQNSKVLVHFSGATKLSKSIAIHPLMSFGNDFFSLEDYQKIHFTVFDQKQSFETLLPGLQNPHSQVPESKQEYYHALCVLGGNFPILLWQKMNLEFQKIGLPQSASQIYLEKILENFIRHPESALTGPLVRNDKITIEKNLNSLKDDPMHGVYKAFCIAYEGMQKATGHTQAETSIGNGSMKSTKDNSSNAKRPG